MHNTIVKMKDGRVFCGPIWKWRPSEGWFSIPSDENAPEKIYFRDVRSAMTKGDRNYGGDVEDRDELARAKTDPDFSGKVWDGS